MTPLRHVVPRSIRRAASGWLAQRRSAALDAHLAAMVARPVPIVAGPWVGEVGFELLYWVPFLRWCAERLDVDPDRFIVMSRGGTASWYRPFSSRYVDVFEQVSPETFRDQHDARIRELGEQKQNRETTSDRDLVAAAMRRAHVSEWSLLHPSWLYEVLAPYWWGHQPSEWVHAHTSFAKLPEPPPSGLMDLPPRYTAVKFYGNDCFPLDERNRGFVRETLRALTSRGPVVALSTGLKIDDHSSSHEGVARVDEFGIRHLPEGIEPARNLQVQCAIVARADAFVGTYGGFSYLAPFYGVKSIAYYSDADGFSRKHLQMAQSA